MDQFHVVAAAKDPSWEVQLSAAVVSAIVAGIAVVVSGVMQYLTLKRSRENTLLTLRQARETARMSALATANQNWESGLRDDLAEFATLTYDVESGFRHAMAANLPWPGDKKPMVDKVDLLYGRIMLRLDARAEVDKVVIKRLNELMSTETESEDLWIDRRDRLIDSTRELFACRKDATFGPGEGAPVRDTDERRGGLKG